MAGRLSERDPEWLSSSHRRGTAFLCPGKRQEKEKNGIDRRRVLSRIPQLLSVHPRSSSFPLNYSRDRVTTRPTDLMHPNPLRLRHAVPDHRALMKMSQEK
jgi:hypothetical protein